MSELQLTVFTYGPNERRVEIELRPPVPDNIIGQTPLIQQWANHLVLSMGMDFKHTNNWDCGTCGKPSRETKVQIASWTHLSPPRMVLYTHHLCEAGKNPCHKAVLEQSKLMAMMSGLPPEKDKYLVKPEGVECPLAASCLGCQKDETAKMKLARCSKCKLVRYCGTQCQADDWNRHKKVCKHIRSVKWVNWD